MTTYRFTRWDGLDGVVRRAVVARSDTGDELLGVTLAALRSGRWIQRPVDVIYDGEPISREVAQGCAPDADLDGPVEGHEPGYFPVTSSATPSHERSGTCLRPPQSSDESSHATRRRTSPACGMPLAAASRRHGGTRAASGCQDESPGRDLSSMPADPLSRAFDRLDDFVAVQTANGGQITLEAAELLQHAAGVDADCRSVIATRAPSLGTDAHTGAVLLGVLIGLFAVQEGQP